VSSPLGLLPATREVVDTDRQYVVGEDAPRLVNGLSVGMTAVADAWELPAPLGRRDQQAERWILDRNGQRETHDRVAMAPRPNTGEMQSGTVVGRDERRGRRENTAATLLNEFEMYGAFLAGFVDDSALTMGSANHMDATVVRDGAHAWMTETHLAVARNKFLLTRLEAPPLSVIHRVLDRCKGAVVELGHRLRYRLQRERRLVEIGHLQEVDEQCVAWLTRQPGRTMEERAGPRQQVLGVVRQQSYDTFENRVLRVFLELARSACVEYLGLRTAQEFSDHPRVKRVHAFQKAVQRLLRRPEIGQLPAPVDESKPNYALQFDRQYRAIWEGYQILRSKRKNDDVLWHWRHRTFGEIVFVDLLGALSGISGGGGLPDELAEVGVRVDPKCGQWLHTPGPLQGRWCRVDGQDLLIEVMAPLHWSAEHGAKGPIVDVVIRASLPSGGAVEEVPLLALAGAVEMAGQGPGACVPYVVVPEGATGGGDGVAAGDLLAGHGVIEWPEDLRQRAEHAGKLLTAVAKRCLGDGG